MATKALTHNASLAIDDDRKSKFSSYSGQSHDGMMVLTELVDWKNG